MECEQQPANSNCRVEDEMETSVDAEAKSAGSSVRMQASVESLKEKGGPDNYNCREERLLADKTADHERTNGEELPFSKELITFSLFGKMPAKLKCPWNESLSSRISEVQEAFKNIPQMLYFSPSSVAFDGIGIYAAESLPKDTLLGPYLGKTVSKEEVDSEANNEWLWEVYEEASLSYFIDARDPKYGNWMAFIQCARSSKEQNLRMAQYQNQLYFVVTADIMIGEELLVWYDEEQYSVYMGVPTGFKEVPPPSLYLEQQQAATSTREKKSPLLSPTPPVYSGGTTGSSFSDSTSTDDSGIGIVETSSGGHTPSDTTLSAVHYSMFGGATAHTNRESSNNGMPAQNTMITGGTSSENSAVYYMDTGTDQMQWYSNPPVMTPTSGDANLAVSNTPSPHLTAPEATNTWVGPPAQPYMDVSTVKNSVGVAPQEGKKQLLYGLFSRCEDGSRWHCEECKRLFSSQGSLRAHARIHTGERPYQCQYCLRAFCQASTLRSHERLHTGEKPYKCEECGRAFTQSAGLRSHRKTHRYDA